MPYTTPNLKRDRRYPEVSPGVAYTIATKRLFCSFDDLQREAERLVGGPIMTHEFADEETWARISNALEEELLEEIERG